MYLFKYLLKYYKNGIDQNLILCMQPTFVKNRSKMFTHNEFCKNLINNVSEKYVSKINFEFDRKTVIKDFLKYVILQQKDKYSKKSKIKFSSYKNF